MLIEFDMNPENIRKILGLPVTIVSLVQDYIEFIFDDDKIVRSFLSPSILHQGVASSVFDMKFKDVADLLIGKSVENIEISQEEIIIFLTDSIAIKMPLVGEERIVHEAVHFVPGLNHPIDVWNAS